MTAFKTVFSVNLKNELLTKVYYSWNFSHLYCHPRVRDRTIRHILHICGQSNADTAGTVATTVAMIIVVG
jgi:hypothetical protein